MLGVERDVGAATHHHAEHRDHHPGAPGGVHPDHLAVGNAARAPQHGGERIGSGNELSIRQRDVAVDHGDRVRRAGRLLDNLYIERTELLLWCGRPRGAADARRGLL